MKIYLAWSHRSNSLLYSRSLIDCVVANEFLEWSDVHVTSSITRPSNQMAGGAEGAIVSQYFSTSNWIWLWSCNRRSADWSCSTSYEVVSFLVNDSGQIDSGAWWKCVSKSTSGKFVGVYLFPLKPQSNWSLQKRPIQLNMPKDKSNGVKHADQDGGKNCKRFGSWIEGYGPWLHAENSCGESDG